MKTVVGAGYYFTTLSARVFEHYLRQATKNKKSANPLRAQKKDHSEHSGSLTKATASHFSKKRPTISISPSARAWTSELRSRERTSSSIAACLKLQCKALCRAASPPGWVRREVSHLRGASQELSKQASSALTGAPQIVSGTLLSSPCVPSPPPSFTDGSAFSRFSFELKLRRQSWAQSMAKELAQGDRVPDQVLATIFGTTRLDGAP